MDNYEAAIRFEATIKETFETELNRIGNEVIEEKMQEIRKEIEKRKVALAASIAQDIRIQYEAMPGTGKMKYEIHIG